MISNYLKHIYYTVCVCKMIILPIIFYTIMSRFIVVCRNLFLKMLSVRCK